MNEETNLHLLSTMPPAGEQLSSGENETPDTPNFYIQNKEAMTLGDLEAVIAKIKENFSPGFISDVSKLPIIFQCTKPYEIDEDFGTAPVRSCSRFVQTYYENEYIILSDRERDEVTGEDDEVEAILKMKRK